MNFDDTIAAVASPVGVGGVGIVRVSGPAAKAVLTRFFLPSSPAFRDFRPRTLHRGRVIDADGNMLDDALAVFMPGPRSFTGEDVAEIHCHGSMILLETLLELICDPANGLSARPAEAGEFSRRAFLNGRMDLTQAEAVAELIAAPGREAVLLSAAKLDGLFGRRIGKLRERLEELRMLVCAAVDFPEEEADCLSRPDFERKAEETAAEVRTLLAGYTRNRRRIEGALLVLAGRVNVGKSSLMNALLGRQRALVTEEPGTTRDFLEERLVFDGLPVCLVDTAGLREGGERVEQLGMAAGRSRMEEADVVLLVLDARLGVTGADRAFLADFPMDRVVLVHNKTDLLPHPEDRPFGLADLPVHAEDADLHGYARVCASAESGEGLDELVAVARRAALADAGRLRPDGLNPNLRQARSLSRALEELEQCADAVRSGRPYDVCSLHLERAGAELAEIMGLDGSGEVLDRVFSTFCIGK
jgi:tRNA modification GTPase